MSDNPMDTIAANVPGLDLWQPRDWPHRRGDDIALSLHSIPLTEDSPGRRSVSCEQCGGGAQCIHDNVLCWRCKGAFCLNCIADPNSLMAESIDSVVRDGFAKCPACSEPLRSIGLVDVFRPLMEMMTSGSGARLIGPVMGVPVIGIAGRNHPHSARLTNFRTGGGSSLVKEAEEALTRAFENEKIHREQAIVECTHAINAINYLASTSMGRQLVARPHDVLLIAHALRAELEGNNELFDAIVAAYPRASVRNPEKDQTWHLSGSAYEALLYPAPGKRHVGRERDQRWRVRGPRSSARQPRRSLQRQIISEATEAGLYSFLGGPFHRRLPPEVTVGEAHVTILDMIQFVRVFPTRTQARDYSRLLFENQKIGEENAPLHARNSSEHVKLLKTTAKSFGVQDLHKVYVLAGSINSFPLANATLSVLASVENGCTKIFISVIGEARDGILLAAKALAYLERQLVEHRSANVASLKEAWHHPDLTMCAYCGENSDHLKTCSRCKLSKYCSVDCQKEHWMMKGKFGHRKLCNDVTRARGVGR